MPAADFAAAQERIALRRAQRAAAARSHDTPQPSRALTLPFPFNRLSTAGLSAWDAIKGRGGTRPEFRVGQVDAELLDDELLSLLKGQVSEGLKYFGHHISDTYSAEILLALRVALWKLSIWNNNASYGAHLQGLRYSDARASGLDRPPPKPWQKVAYGAVTIGGRYCWSKWESYLVSASDDFAAPSSARVEVLSRLTEQISNLHDVASLASFLVFLVNGRYRTLTDRLLRLRLTPTSHSTSREVSFEYLNRQLVWHAFTEFLLFLLPLVGISRWRRILARSLRRLTAAFWALLGRSPTPSDNDPDAEKNGELGFLPERTCAICYRDQNPTTSSEADVLTASAGGGGVIGSAATDITNPYAADCGCVYCFACIAQRIANEEGEGWTCLRCGETVRTCQPWNGDVLEPTRRTQSSSHGSDRPATRGAMAREGGKSVLFAQTHDHSEMDESLQHIDPMPEPQGESYGHDEAVDVTADALLEKTRGLDLGESLAFTERDEWARESERSSDDEQSEEYDEDEEQEGEELEFEYEGQ
jgi:peroxin-2